MGRVDFGATKDTKSKLQGHLYLKIGLSQSCYIATRLSNFLVKKKYICLNTTSSFFVCQGAPKSIFPHLNSLVFGFELGECCFCCLTAWGNNYYLFVVKKELQCLISDLVKQCFTLAKQVFVICIRVGLSWQKSCGSGRRRGRVQLFLL